ncbi:helix-turn-helix domain-containing protein [Patescibacteria group bacterium]|nr:helix-turn-helix domain-containing protein [Patescibacteria group bacterium]
MDKENLQTIFEEALKEKDLTYKKLSILTSVPEKFIIALKNMETHKLPATPYIRGYLEKICEVLDLNLQDIWTVYKEGIEHKSSGSFDKLPTNRFVIQKLNKKTVISFLTAIIIIIFFASNFNNFFSKPYLKITNPKDSLMVVSEPLINLTGQIRSVDKLTINGEEVVANPAGDFELAYELQLGLNTIEFKVKKILGKENSQIKQIIFEEPEKLIDVQTF